MTRNSNGGWNIEQPPIGECWDAYEIEYYKNGELVTLSQPRRPITNSVIDIEASTHCPNSASDPDKGYCVFGTDKMTGATGDDMFKLEAGEWDGYFEYETLNTLKGNNSGLKFIERTSLDSTDKNRAMMMPSGPPGVLTDFTGFMDRGPLNTEPGCWKADIKICALPLPDTIPPLKGICGMATERHYTEISQIPEADVCSQGIPAGNLSFNETDYQFEWTCYGVGEGPQAQSVECTSIQSMDGVCNENVNGYQFETEAALRSEPLCTSGEESGFTDENEGRWIWTCAAIGDGEPQGCLALKPGFSCDSRVGDVMYIMDDSGSMGGAAFGDSDNDSKIVLAKRVMDETFRKHINKENEVDPDQDKIGIAGLDKLKNIGNARFLNWNGSDFDSMATDGVTESMLTKGIYDISQFGATGSSTPLYARVQQAAALLGNGAAGEPNAIIAFSDGASSGNLSNTVSALSGYTNLRVHTIDVEDNRDKLRPLSQETGGLYLQARDEAQFQALLDLAVLGCDKRDYDPVEPTEPTATCALHTSDAAMLNYFGNIGGNMANKPYEVHLYNGRQYSDIVGAGSYPDAAVAMPHGGTFDGLAIAKDTKVKIYGGKNFTGGIVFEAEGPAIFNSSRAKWNTHPEFLEWKNSPAVHWDDPDPKINQFKDGRNETISRAEMNSWRNSGSIIVECKQPVSGLCGNAHSNSYVDAAAANGAGLCASGFATPSSVSGDGPWNWTCEVTNGGTDASCSADQEIVQDVIPDEQEEPPTNECFFHVTGQFLNDTGTNSYGKITKIGVDDQWSTLVGPGNYSTATPFAEAHATTFDGLAIGSGTRIIIYSRPNFTGTIQYDATGPRILYSHIVQRYTPRAFTTNWPQFPQYPPSVRDLYGDNMHQLGVKWSRLVEQVGSVVKVYRGSFMLPVS